MKPTVATAAMEAMRLRGKPLTAREILAAIEENGLYIFKAAKPMDVVRHALKGLCAGSTRESEPALEEHPGGRFALRRSIGEIARSGTDEARSVEFGRAETHAPAERQTIIRAIREVMAKKGTAMTVKQVYAAIKRDNLYPFKASEPVHVVRSQIRRHSLGVDFPTASETKHFALEANAKYRLLKTPVTQKSRLSNIGIARSLDANSSARAVTTTTTGHQGETSVAEARSEVFVSYSHRDEKWMRRLQVHLAPLERKRQIVRWDDTRLHPGGKWRKEIAAALCRARIAILLVSADFLASEFIVENELPPLLKAVNTEGVRILPVIVSPCRFEKSELGEFQALNSPSKPLNSLQRAGYERVFVQIADAVESALFTEG